MGIYVFCYGAQNIFLHSEHLLSSSLDLDTTSAGNDAITLQMPQHYHKHFSRPGQIRVAARISNPTWKQVLMKKGEELCFSRGRSSNLFHIWLDLL